jgi:mannose-6-phosphate isomerase
VPALDPLVGHLRHGEEPARLRRALTWLLGLPGPAAAVLADDVAAKAHQSSAHALVELLHRDFPGDVGILIALLLNHVQLRPGEALFVPAGRPHAYLGGVAVEVMAASDNVLRAGLTTKRVDTAELLQVVRYEVCGDPRLAATDLDAQVRIWDPPVSEFRLAEVVARPVHAPVAVPGSGPRILFCLHGAARVEVGGDTFTLHSGESAFVPACAGEVRVSGAATVIQACPSR